VSPRWFAGVDVGGTFTDLALASSDGRLVTAKVATTPADPRDGVVAGIARVLARSGVPAAAVTRVVHGTTLATNVILERRGGPVAFVTTEGFGDMLRLGREVRGEDERFDLSFAVPQPPVVHPHTFEVRERCGADGRVLVPLDGDSLRGVVERVVAAAPTAVAVCLLHSYANPAHEVRVAAACRAALGPAVPVVASSDVWPEVREYERAMTTVMCAYVGPVMTAYLEGLVTRLRELGVACDVDVMESSGGVMSAAMAAERPVFTVESGGAAGVTAAGFVGSLLGAGDVISFDMGGTTAKAGIVRRGRPALAHGFHVGGRGSRGGSRAPKGFPIKTPVVDLAEVGAGGGSIAWIDGGGALQVGPRSAGADPGPACYGLGGVDPTVTDANLVLGYLRSGELSGGVDLSVDLARGAVARVAGPLGLSVEDAAHAVHAIVNANMAAAIRMVTVERGIDPRDFTMVGFGGAGPIHLARLAETFGIGTVVVPWAAGVSSAVGLVTADLTVDRVRTEITRDEDLDPSDVNHLFAELVREGMAQLPVAASTDDMRVHRSVDARYRGQAHQLTVPVPDGELTADDLAWVLKSFEESYEQTYGIAGEGPVDVVGYRAQVVRVVDKYAPVAAGPGRSAPAPEPTGERSAHFVEAGGYLPTPVYDRDLLETGDELVGPAVIDGDDTSIVVPPGYLATIDGWRDVLLRRGEIIDPGASSSA
jgi:N-methylhydantoinase A